MVRLLYGARNSLFIGITATLITIAARGDRSACSPATSAAAIDAVISRGARRPVGVPGAAARRRARRVAGHRRPEHRAASQIEGNSIWIPTLIIGVVDVVYLARPIRGQVLSLREKEFVEAARAQGAGDLRIMFSELLPNLASTMLVFFPILVANAILLEAALSFLGAGVQPPNPSWGTMISDGLRLLVERAAPDDRARASMLVLTVLSLNIFGEGVRDALDPRAKVRLEH